MKKVLFVLCMLCCLIMIGCSFDLGLKGSQEHEHEYSDWQYDDYNHWKECSCGDRIERSSHVWGEGVVTLEPTVDRAGVETFICTICGQKKESPIRKLTPSEGLVLRLYSDSESYQVTSIGTCIDSDIIIPSTYNDLPVRVIAFAAFQNAEITSVTIPDSVTKIYNKAFSGCVNLATVKMGEGVSEIGMYAFQACTSLITITLPKSLTKVDTPIFGNSHRLVEVINKSDLDLSLMALETRVVIKDESESKLVTTEEGFVLWENGSDVYLADYLGTSKNITVPSNVTKLLDYALYKRGITKLVIGKNVKQIGIYQFSYNNMADVYYTGTEEEFIEIQPEQWGSQYITVTYNYVPSN